MADYSIIKLTNLSPFHIGTGKENYDFSSSALQSDTLTSAIASIRAQQGKTEDLDSFLSSFCMSSAFPFYKTSFFLPKPQGRISVAVQGEEEHQYRKKLKKVRFIDKETWLNLLSGRTVVISQEQIKKDLIVSSQDIGLPTLSKNEVNERVTVPRSDDPSEPFYFEWKYFHKDGGLFILTDAKGELLGEIMEYLEILGGIGLGTDKNVGGGKFTPVEAGNFHVGTVENSNALLLLSPYIPTETELSAIDLSNSRYNLIKRGGYLAGSDHTTFRHLRKRSIFMFDMGSVLKTSGPITGKIVDLRPEWNDSEMHSVYRSGRPICIPIKL